MRVSLTSVSKGRALPETSLSFASGTARLAVAETEQRPAVLGLIASGRMRASGEVLIDGAPDARALRRRVALVDAPEVCDPAPDVAVAGVAAEELMFAGRPSSPLAVRRWLTDAGFADLARVPIADVAPGDRVRLLLELTALRAGVEGMVLVSPDRHGGSPEEWWGIVEELAARGFAMLAIAGDASAMVLDGRAQRAERADEPAASAVPAAEPRTIAPAEDDPAGGILTPADTPPAEEGASSPAPTGLDASGPADALQPRTTGPDADDPGADILAPAETPRAEEAGESGPQEPGGTANPPLTTSDEGEEAR